MARRSRSIRRWVGLAVALMGAFAVACGGGGSSGSSKAAKANKGLVLIDVNVGGNDGVPLNQIVTFQFSEALAPDTVRPDTFQIRQGPDYGKQVPGDFEVDGNIVNFYPRLPVLPDLSDAGLQPGTTYKITLPGYPKVAVVRSLANRRLAQKTTVSFQTAASGSPGLFVDNFIDPLPPKVTEVNPPDGATEVPAASKIILTFDKRPLLPATVTASNIHLTLVSRLGTTYNRPVAGTPVLTQSYQSVSVEFQPTFPLADQATYKLTVERRVSDLVGNDVEPFESTFSIRDEPPRPGSFTLNFDATDKAQYDDTTQTTASWNDVVSGALAGLFTVSGGNGTAGDLLPNTDENIRPDDYKRGVDVVTKDNQEYDVYNFRTLDIPNGVTVRFSPRSSGPNRPAMVLCLGKITINGTLTVSGGRGSDEPAVYSNTTPGSGPGGGAGPGGTDGADRYSGSGIYPNYQQKSADDVPNGGGGGEGADQNVFNYELYGAGGGGGGSRTAGGKGTSGQTVTSPSWGGVPGQGGKSEEDINGDANLARTPNVGGGGGGAGSNGYYYYYSWYQGAGSGGGGGGAITVQGAGDVEIGSSGQITADGGHGGNGPNSANWSNYPGGAGGGGAGGSILVRATENLNLDPGATLSVVGGTGGQWTATNYTQYVNVNERGTGGDGGDGYIRLEAKENPNSPGKPLISGLNTANLSYAPVSTGVFAPVGGGTPTIGETLWVNLGVFNPTMVAPSASDIVATLYNASMKVEVQMAIEDPNNLGQPDLADLDVTDQDHDGQFDDTLNTATLSEWTDLTNITDLNGFGYQFFRIRVTFQLANTQTPDSPLPYLDQLTIHYQF